MNRHPTNGDDMNIYRYANNEFARTATTEEIDRYEAILAELHITLLQHDVGAIDGAEFGLEGVTIYIDR